MDDLHVYYGQIHALKGVSIRLARGEIGALLCNNGAGKTTALLETGQVIVSGPAAELQEHPEVRHAYLGEGA